MIETIVVCISAAIVFAAVLLRLNNLYIWRERPVFWNVVEVIGLAILLSGCAGVIGECLLPHGDFHHARLVFIFGCGLTSVGVSRGYLCQVIARLQGWDGTERRHGQVVVEKDLRQHRG